MKTSQHGLHVRVDGASGSGEVVFEERLPPSFLDLPPDDEVSAASEIVVSGKAYRASEWIVVEGRVKTSFRLPCAICNEMCEYAVDIRSWEQNIPAKDVVDGVIDLSEPLREAVLIEIPFFAKCGGGTCRNIDDVKRFFRSEEAPEEREETHQPFLSLLQEI